MEISESIFFIVVEFDGSEIPTSPENNKSKKRIFCYKKGETKKFFSFFGRIFGKVEGQIESQKRPQENSSEFF